MAKISETYDFGQTEDMTNEELLWLLQRMYTELAEAINRKPDYYERSTDGQTTDTFLSNGDININTSTRKVEMLTEHTDPTTVVWTTIS